MEASKPTEVQKEPSYRHAVLYTLAAVGAVVLIMFGIIGALYSSRLLTGSGLGNAAVYLGSLFKPSESPDLSVVPTPTASSTFITFGNSASSTATTTGTRKPTTPAATTPGQRTATTVPIGGTTAPALYGLPDLSIVVTAIGYLDSNSTDSFVGSARVPDGKRPAVKFTVKNIGTNASGAWRFSAALPTRSSFTYRSPAQQSLNPNESIDYVMGFDQARSGNRTVSITVNDNGAVRESNTTNNTIDVQFVIED